MTRGVPLLLFLAACTQTTRPDDTSTTDTGIHPQGDTGTVQPPALADHVVINELLSKNDSINTDAAGHYDDWLEVFNPTSDPVDLSTWALTDASPTDTASPPWPFPGGTTLAPGAYLLVWCDSETESSGLHAAFTLSASGDDITLLNGSDVIDTVSTPALDTDTSYARIPNGSVQWDVTTSPTPAATNILR